MKVIVRRFAAITCILVFAFISCGLAAFEPLYGLLALDPEKGVHLELSAELLSHMPYSEDRLKSLNSLFDFLSLTADIQDERCSAVLKVDRVPAVTFVHEQAGRQIREWTDALPDTVFTGDGETGLLEGFAPDMSEGVDADIGLKGDEYAVAKDLKNLLNSMPTLFPEIKQKNEKIRVKIGEYGIATRKISIVYPASLVTVKETFQDILANQCVTERLKNWLLGISFTGRQTLTQYITEEDEVIRTVYAGSIRYADGKVHKVNLNWKCSANDLDSCDDIVLKAPAASGNDRDTLELNYGAKTENGAEMIHCQYEYTRVRDKDKDVYHGNVGFQTSTGDKKHVNGTFTFNRKRNKEKKQGWIFEPDIDIDPGLKTVEGQISIDRTQDDTSPESLILHIVLRNSADTVAVPEDTENRIPMTEDNLMSEIWPKISAAVNRKLILPLLKLPDQALKYFNEGLDDGQWNAIYSAIQ